MYQSRLAIPVSAAVALLVTTSPASAQDGAIALEEVVVTARKREESLQDVPVAISVFSADLLADANLFDVQDLYELTPGLQFDTNFGDRNSSTPGVRGVQSLEIAPTRQKASTFIDGVPLVGQQGNLGLESLERVEVYRGPQSAAFGRATFAGAVNYVTRDPGDEFSGSVTIATSDLGRDQARLSLDGPITDTVGFTLDYGSEQYDGPDEWVSSDGYRLGGTTSDQFSVKFKFTPSDTFDAEVRVLTRETDDNPSNRYMLQDSAACSNYTAPNGNLYYQGEFNCDISIPSTGITLLHDLTQNYVDATGGGFTQEELDMFAQSYSVLDPQVTSERDRVQAELNWSIGESTLQVLGFTSEEEYLRWWDADTSATPLTITAMGGALGASMNVNTMADPSSIEENYAEVRWVSPEDERFRYVIGASYYDYDFLTNIYAQYGAVVAGTADELGVGPVQIFSENAKNVGAFFNLMYDISDETTVSVEGRYQVDDITNLNNVTGQTFNNETTSFQPRIAINHRLSDQVTVYGQYSEGNNPAGVNVNFTNQQAIWAIQDALGAGAIVYDENTFLNFEEENLTNIEVGLKGTFLENRLQLATALYAMEWEDAVQPYNLNWNDAWNDGTSPNAVQYNMGMAWAPPFTMSRTFLNQGTIDTIGLEAELNYRISDAWSTRITGTLQNSEFSDFCSLFAVNDLGLPADKTTEEGAAYDCAYVNGNTFNRQPDITFTTSLTYTNEIGSSGWSYSVRGDLMHTGSNYMDDVNYLQIPAMTILNLSMMFRNDDWTIRAFVNNASDNDTPTIIETTNDYAVALNGSVDGFRITPMRPREFGLNLTYGF
jgi:iron complex outermembrane receptor protein